jgi:hypothetical protein
MKTGKLVPASDKREMQFLGVCKRVFTEDGETYAEVYVHGMGLITDEYEQEPTKDLLEAGGPQQGPLPDGTMLRYFENENGRFKVVVSNGSISVVPWDETTEPTNER